MIVIANSDEAALIADSGLLRHVQVTWNIDLRRHGRETSGTIQGFVEFMETHNSFQWLRIESDDGAHYLSKISEMLSAE